jgi:hypothetical protein
VVRTCDRSRDRWGDHGRGCDAAQNQIDTALSAGNIQNSARYTAVILPSQSEKYRHPLVILCPTEFIINFHQKSRHAISAL